MAYFIGLMSGTSMDGIDAALANIGDEGFNLVATHSHPWPDDLKLRLQQLALPGDDEIDRMGEADARAGELFAAAVDELLQKAGVSAEQVKAVGSHGQTIRHRPEAETPFTLQIGDPNRLAAATGITTIADFRRRDMAAGGQGAPLAPAFHAALFGSADENRVVLNIGGIANITRLPSDSAEAVIGFDCGPGNRLMDDWITRNLGDPFDNNGDWAASGVVDSGLLERLLADPYFSQQPPKSTGTERFNIDWLDKMLSSVDTGLNAETVQATLLELTAVTIRDAVQAYCPGTASLFVCGGGAHNRVLIARLVVLMPDIDIATTAITGIDPDWVEAAAFAWLASRTLNGLGGNLPSVTGANETVVLGGIYPA